MVDQIYLLKGKYGLSLQKKNFCRRELFIDFYFYQETNCSVQFQFQWTITI